MAVFKQKGYVTGYKIDFFGGNDNYANNLLDSTSTIEELKQWGFALPFDLDVKAFVANVIKSRRMGRAQRNPSNSGKMGFGIHASTHPTVLK